MRLVQLMFRGGRGWFHKACLSFPRSWIIRYGEVQVFSDIGSGLNEKMMGFLKLLEMVSERKDSKIIVAYEDGLKRFGLEKLRRLLSAFGTEIEVINHEEKTPREELVEDLARIVSHFAGKLYEMRSPKYKEVVKGVKQLISG